MRLVEDRRASIAPPSGEVETPLKDTLADALKYLPMRIAQATAAVASVVILSRMMGPHDYGVYVVLLAGSGLVSTLVFNWVTSAAFRFYEEARRAGELADLSRELASCYLAMAVVWLVLGGAAVTLAADGVVAVSVGALACLVLLGFLEPVIAIYQGLAMAGRRPRQAVALGVADAVLRCALGIAGALLLQDRVAGVLAGQLAAAGLVVLGLAVIAPARVVLRLDRLDRKRIWTFVSYGYPITGASMSSWALSVSDRLLMTWMLGSSAVGVYAVGYQLGSNAVLFLSSTLMAGAYPVLIRHYEQRGEAAAARLLGKLVSGVLIGGGALVIFLAAASAALVAAWIGVPYAEAAAVMPLIAAGQLLAALSEYFAKSFQLKKRTAPLFLITLAAAAVNVAANLMLIPRLGLLGAGLATLAAYAAGLGMSIVLGRKLLPIPMPLGSMCRVGVGAGVSWLALAWLRPEQPGSPASAVLLGILGLAVFGATLWVTREPAILILRRFLPAGGKRVWSES